jgi:hypothetical protein
LQIYLENGGTKFKTILFRKLKNEAALKHELQLLLNNQANTTQSLLKEPKLPVLPKEVPKEIEALEKEWRKYYKEASFLHQTLAYMPTDEERRLAALTILDNMDKAQEIWDKLDFYKEHGYLPKEIEAKVSFQSSLSSLFKRRNTLRTYISKFKGKADKVEKLKDWQSELLEIQQIIEEKESELE